MPRITQLLSPEPGPGKELYPGIKFPWLPMAKAFLLLFTKVITSSLKAVATTGGSEHPSPASSHSPSAWGGAAVIASLVAVVADTNNCLLYFIHKFAS